jgi:hypothetical protein
LGIKDQNKALEFVHQNMKLYFMAKKATTHSPVPKEDKAEEDEEASLLLLLATELFSSSPDS